MNNKVYIAGKVTGDPGYKAKFAEAERILRDNSLGILQPVNPAEFVPEGMGWHRAMALCLLRLAGCSTVYFLPDWRDSRGARIEHRWAKKLRKKIIYQQ